MKKLLLFALLIGASFTQGSSTPHAAPDFIIVTDGVVYLTADVYMTAQYVRVELLDFNGRIQASTVTSAGSTVSFPWNDMSHAVRSTYHLDSWLEIIIVDEIPE